MQYFDYLETEWTSSSERLAVSPKDVTIPNQARFNAVQSLITVSRTLIKWGYMMYFVASYMMIKLRLKKAPVFKSSIPAQPGKPDLSVVQPPPPEAS